jgi:tRNA G18 (ribose-2'-O)-methylase SpoU
LRAEGIKIVVVEQTTHSVLLQDFIPEVDHKYAFVFGNEVDGVSELFIKNADLCIEIPQIGTKHSLNVSVCAGIVMWHMYSYLKTT